MKPGCRLRNTQTSVPTSQKAHCVWVINVVDSINRILYNISSPRTNYSRVETKYLINRDLLCIWNFAALLDIQWRYLFRTLSMPFNSFNSDVVKWGRSVKCRKKMAIGTPGGGGHIPREHQGVVDIFHGNTMRWWTYSMGTPGGGGHIPWEHQGVVDIFQQV